MCVRRALHPGRFPPHPQTGLVDGVFIYAQHIGHFLGAQVEFFEGQQAGFGRRQIGELFFLPDDKLRVYFFKNCPEFHPVVVGEDGGTRELFEVFAAFAVPG